MIEYDFDFSNKKYSAYILSIILNYLKEIVGSNIINSRKFDQTKIRIFLTSYAIAINTFTFASFKNQSQGKLCLRSFNETIVNFNPTEADFEELAAMVSYFRSELTSRPNSGQEFALKFYCEIDRVNKISDVAIWVKNYLTAIHIAYYEFSGIVEKNYLT